MDIRFSANDIRELRAALADAGLGTSPARVRELADAVHAAFAQQLAYEAEYLAESIADEEVAP